MVWKVSTDHYALACARGNGPQIEALRIGLRNLRVRQLGAQDGNELAIPLDRDHMRSCCCQRVREVAEPGPQLDHPVAWAQPRQRRQRGEQLLVSEEILPPLLLGAQSVAAEQLGGLHSRHPGSADIAASARSPRRSR